MIELTKIFHEWHSVCDFSLFSFMKTRDLSKVINNQYKNKRHVKSNKVTTLRTDVSKVIK